MPRCYFGNMGHDSDCSSEDFRIHRDDDEQYCMHCCKYICVEHKAINTSLMEDHEKYDAYHSIDDHLRLRDRRSGPHPDSDIEELSVKTYNKLMRIDKASAGQTASESVSRLPTNTESADLVTALKLVANAILVLADRVESGSKG